jgi:spore coat polysaccharide biosynthesis predicted glycosyltransferase SpsG
MKELHETFPELKLKVILGSSVPDINSNFSGVQIYRSLNAVDIRDVFLSSDLVISAGGQTLFELAALGIPTIPVQVMDNQTEDIDGFLTLGFFDEVFQWDDPLLKSKIVNKVKKLWTIEARRDYLHAFCTKEIGGGIDRIITHICNF